MPKDPIVRGKTAQFTAVVHDANQPTSELTIAWYRDKTCDKVPGGTPAAFGLTFPFEPTERGSGCVAVVVTDEHGATATMKASFQIINQAPEAVIEVLDQTILDPNQPLRLPLYGTVTLSGADSYDPDPGDTPLITYQWNVYGPDGTKVPFSTCPDKAKGDHVCTFRTVTPGSYRIELVVSDELSRVAASQRIDVGEDQPPSIVVDEAQPLPQLSPDDPPLFALSNEDNTFTIHRVVDDGDPYPTSDPANTLPAKPAGFTWSMRELQPGVLTSWKRLTMQTGPSLTVRGGTYLPQQIIQLRVEYRDRVTACQPRTAACIAAYASCDADTIICYAPELRAQWVTWTVSFR